MELMRLKDEQGITTPVTPVQPASPYRQQTAQQQPASPYRQQPVSNKKPLDTELLVGVKGMGIVASILVFISFILFAMYLLPGLTDTIKMVMMFVISIVMTGVGLFFWFRKKESLFFLSLGACGVDSFLI